MLFNKLTRRKYAGVLVIALSILFLLSQLGVPLLFSEILPESPKPVALASLTGIMIGLYLIAGPLPALIAMIPVAAGGCVGCGGEEEREEPEPDLGEPPPPPAASIFNSQSRR